MKYAKMDVYFKIRLVKNNMSYDIDLLDPTTKKVACIEGNHQIKGGIYRIGGSDVLSLNITYNYSSIFYKIFGELGIRTIYGKTGEESLIILRNAIAQLGNDINNDYWKCTEGNAKLALINLVQFALMRPDCIWDGD